MALAIGPGKNFRTAKSTWIEGEMGQRIIVSVALSPIPACHHGQRAGHRNTLRETAREQAKDWVRALLFLGLF